MKRTFDIWILIFIIFLTLIGIVMIFSSSLVMASKSSFYNFDAYYFLKRQIIWLIFGSLILILAFRADWIFLRKFSLIGIIFTIILLILVLIPGVGKTVLGARRWIDLGFLSFQPSEIAKFTLIFYLADVISRKYDKFEKPTFLIIPFLILGIFCFLIEKEPDLGTVLILGGTFLGILYLGGIKKHYLLSLILSGIVLVGFRILHESYRLRRLTAFINPWKDPQDSGYHIIQSLIALGSGGIFGLGLGQSRQKFFYLPEQHTDFIFAILGEELGLIG
ncbi:MAG: FtsW/RodA/SpoVE family cell cycle protein, partial [Armatimonadetes bacterium]|nr:FtsW/RodA/SpoVE family cell cycle protein [Armatimonadota bacterium]